MQEIPMVFQFRQENLNGNLAGMIIHLSCSSAIYLSLSKALHFGLQGNFQLELHEISQ
jgi:hypothetical protein